MLILNRKVGERIAIGSDIFITLLSIGHHEVRIGIDAPKSIPIFREEYFEKIKRKEQEEINKQEIK